MKGASMNFPDLFIQNMKDLLQEEYSEYEQSFHQSSYHGLRINTNKISVEDFLKISPFQLEPIPWTTNGFYYSEKDKPSKHPYYYAGLYYLQEPSAMLPAQVLPIEKGDIVLDTCAAPGGKSTELSNKLHQTGLLFSNDISTSRCQGLLKNLELSGCKNGYVCSEDLIQLSKSLPNSFDKILIDAPCSGEGMFRKEPSLIKSWIERGNDYYANIQKQIIEAGYSMLKPGGSMVYSTCTFSPSENEEVIQTLLHNHNDVHLEELPLYEGFQKGIQLEECRRLYPHKIHGEGHFVALLKKEGKQNHSQSKPTKTTIPNEEAKDFFCHLSMKLENGSFTLKKEKLLFEPDNPFSLKGIRILRSGLYLGECKKNRFEPSQAFALALKLTEFDQVINLNIQDERVIKYLKCETIDVSDINTSYKGWVLIGVNSYPLGWGKISKGIIKNKYMKGWRWQ